MFFVDFGNGEKMSLSRTRRLQDDLFSLPAQAIRCKLDQVFPTEVGENFKSLSLLIQLSLN